MTLAQNVSIAQDVLFQDLGDEVVLLNIQSEQYYGLEGVGVRLWQLFSEDGSVARALEAIRAEYDVDGETAARDLGAFLDKMTAAKLLSVGA